MTAGSSLRRRFLAPGSVQGLIAVKMDAVEVEVVVEIEVGTKCAGGSKEKRYEL